MKKTIPTSPKAKTVDDAVRRCRQIASQFSKLNTVAKKRVTLECNHWLERVISKHAVIALALNEEQNVLTLTLDNKQRLVFSVSHPEEWLNYKAVPGPYYRAEKDPIIKDIWKQKEVLGIESRKLSARIPQERLLEATGMEPSNVD